MSRLLAIAAAAVFVVVTAITAPEAISVAILMLAAATALYIVIFAGVTLATYVQQGQVVTPGVITAAGVRNTVTATAA